MSNFISAVRRRAWKVVNTELSFIRQNKLVVALIVFATVTRLALTFPNQIPFAFDHGKDSIAVLEMIVTGKPALIGPWTSIPGLFFGPGWYYLLAPFYFILGGNPYGGVLAMIFVLCASIYLAYRWFGFVPAVVISSAQGFIHLSTSAWNPFPMPLLMLIVLAVLVHRWYHWVGFLSLGLAVGLSFHFSSAFAFFYLPSLASIFAYRIMVKKEKLEAKLFGWLLAGFTIPFLPQMIFELRHNFIQSKAVIAYFISPPVEQTKAVLIEVLRVSLMEMLTVAMPMSNVIGSNLFKILVVGGFVFLAMMLRFMGRLKVNLVEKNKVELVILSILPLLGFWLTHFNVWYLYGLFSLVAVVVGVVVNNMHAYFKWLVVALFLLTPLTKIWQHYNYEYLLVSNYRTFLPVKLRALDKIDQLSEGKAYKVFSYVPDIYDFSYQYLYMWRGYQGERLPVEFAYEPGKKDYVKQKGAMVSEMSRQSDPAEYVFFIVEEAENETFLQNWWGRQEYDEIIYTEQLSETVTLHQARL